MLHGVRQALILAFSLGASLSAAGAAPFDLTQAEIPGRILRRSR